MNICSSGFEEKICPISKTMCPGMCIYSDILENIDLGIIVLDILKETLEFQNSASLEILSAATKPKDYAAIRNLLLTSPLPSMNSGQTKTVYFESRLLGYTVYNIMNRYCWIFLRDITEKARLESIAETVNTMDNIGYIFMGIRHEIGNPLNSIKMSLSVLKKNVDAFPRATVLEYIDRSLGEILRIEYLLKGLKNFSMFEKLQLQELDLKEFVANFRSLIENDFLMEGISLQIGFSFEPYRVRADARALHQVLLNLLTNASDAVKGRVNPVITIRGGKEKGYATLTVEDNGCGMTADQQKNLFKPFHTVKATGTGLGLVITKKLLTQMEGRIEVTSRENQGTAVTIVLPEASSEKS
ncbi:MAG: HAMP domain-containing sensor histidine kinase [bacterium]|jgi:signal transduction histidine kinase